MESDGSMESVDNRSAVRLALLVLTNPLHSPLDNSMSCPHLHNPDDEHKRAGPEQT